MWEEIVLLAATVEFSDCEDSMISQFSCSGFYSSQSLYKVLNFRGVQPVYIPAV
jgi:hypothetical protein